MLDHPAQEGSDALDILQRKSQKFRRMLKLAYGNDQMRTSHFLARLESYYSEWVHESKERILKLTEEVMAAK